MVADPQPPTRSEIQALVGSNDYRLIRAIERLFEVAGEITPEQLQGILDDLNTHIQDFNNPHQTDWGDIQPTVPYEDAGTGDKSNPATMPPADGAPAYPPQYHPHVEEDISDLDRVRWRNVWQSGTYQKNDSVFDVGWLMVANKETTDRAAPQQDNNQIFDLVESPSWTGPKFTGLVDSGREWELTRPITVIGVQVWAPDTAASVDYSVISYQYPTGSPEDAVFNQITLGTLNQGEWSTVAVPRALVLSGSTFGIILRALNSGASTVVTGGWNRAANDSNAALDPGSQAWGTRNSDASVRINYTDLDSVDRSTELQGVVPGSVITISQTDTPSRSMSWTTLADGTDYTTHIAFESVSFDGDGPDGEPAFGEPCTITIDVPVPSATEYVELVGGNPSHSFGTSRGLLSLDGVEQSVDANAYGVRILTDTWTASPDWDLMSLSAGTSASGSGDGVASIAGLSPNINRIATNEALLWLTL